MTTLDNSNVCEAVATQEKSGDLLNHVFPQNENMEDNSNDDTPRL